MLMMDDFISEDDLLTFEGFLKYQAVDPAMLTPDELAMWRDFFDEAVGLRESGPKVGLMRLRQAPGEEKYGVALRDGSELWLTMWVRCSAKGEIFVMYQRADAGNPHASYHLDGTYHHKSYGSTGIRQTKQPLSATLKGSEHLGMYMGHGKSTGAVCDPKAFDGLVIVDPGILGPKHGSVGVDLVAPGYEATWSRDIADRFYFGGVVQGEIFSRSPRPSVAITIQR
jgi:hypothetical protein